MCVCVRYHVLTTPRSLTHPLDKLSNPGAYTPQSVRQSMCYHQAVVVGVTIGVTCSVFTTASTARHAEHMLCVMIIHEHLQRRTDVATDGSPIVAPPCEATDTSLPSIEMFTVGAAAELAQSLAPDSHGPLASLCSAEIADVGNRRNSIQ